MFKKHKKTKNHATSQGVNSSELLDALYKNMCPDCGGKEFLEGPRGGMCVNIKCNNCGSKFNISETMRFAERIYRPAR